MAAADPVFESLQRLPSMLESIDESLTQLCKDNSGEAGVDLRKNLMGYYHDLHKAMQSRYETLKIKEKQTGEPGTSGKNKESKTSKVTGSSPASSSFSTDLSSVEVRPEIKTLCDMADGRGLRNYIVDNMEEIETLGKELLVALGKGPDSAKLVIKALEGCDLSKRGSSKRERCESLLSDDVKACNLLLESLYPVFGNDDSDAVPSDVKDSARKIAQVWRENILGTAMKIHKNAYKASKFDVQVFLQLLATFRLAADYKKDGLWGLARCILRRQRTPELCRSLGLSSKIPTLHIKSDPVMALRYAHVCGVMDKVDPVVLLTSYLKREEEGAKVLLTNGHGSADSQDAANIKVVRALRRVIRLIKEYGLQSHFCEDDLQNKLRILVQENEDLIKKREQDANGKAEEKEGEKDAEKKAQIEEDRNKATKKKAQEEVDRKTATEKKAREGERKKTAVKKAQEKEDREKVAEKKAQEEKDRKKAAEKKAQETEDRKRATEKMLQHKRSQSFEPGYGPLERESYASKRAKHALPDVITRVAGGIGNSKASRYNIDGVQKKCGIIGHDHHTSAFSAANRSSTGPAAGAFTSAPSIAAQINDERRRHSSAFGTSKLTPIGSSMCDSSVPAGAFAVPLYNVAEVNYEGRGQQSYTMNRGEVDKNYVRASAYGTGDLGKSSTVQSNNNNGGRGQQNYKLNFVEVDNNPVSTSTYGTSVMSNSSTTQTHYEIRGPELYTSAFGGGNTGSIGSSVYGSNSRTIPSSDVNQGGHERTLGQYSGFAGRNMIPTESSGYGSGVSTAPPSNVTQGHFQSRSVIDKYWFNSRPY